ncbi:hypothetical protein [Chlorogloea sp. CCALA 695]|uniref:hypothetical protein n=1 Tax=Chlorogloea sp. CCALA 695 TaxID=2107693 RepID=UPI000D073BE7|nr:hypothetical protein [Chlorogloea sp. CCALA 695]PSB28366.1 hypothetical protein C7B70_21155 [Chlorogloea sp. CCALA 695]
MLPRIKFLGNISIDLYCLFGIPYSGTKPEKTSRLLVQTEIQRPSTRVWAEAGRLADGRADTSFC